MPSPKSIALLGATGSIGSSTLKVLRQHPGRFRLGGVAIGSKIDLLLPILREFDVPLAVVFDPAAAEALSRQWSGKVLSGMEGLMEMVADPSIDYLLNGLVGSIGVRPTLEAIRHGKQVGLANKESMVMAGALINAALAEHPESALYPIDSEHSAIFQCLAGRPTQEVDFLQLTASGGPFRERPRAEFAAITKAEALKHPTWVMGEKITIDSATLMNKGLEVIEAHFLFGVDFDRIQVVIHPKSIVHSLVQFRDGSLMAQLGCPDMCVPIQYALSYPERLPLETPRVDLAQVGKLEFFQPDFEKFPCLRLAFEAGTRGGTAPAILNAANEAAVDLFLKDKIAFHQIPGLLEKVLGRASIQEYTTLDEAIAADAWARAMAVEFSEPN
ncbi:MAG: 1-deoxy-D-xylulose-5-phosphate reductoisomerase [Fibrobacteria bacterium]|jgi:1-deoxy-D-xylulose-5-phosphate reductoisomerase|nr:1-deoxy-D-xylulose-5-phosphate reductoisomerase [Fibrobacteria bacterium]